MIPFWELVTNETAMDEFLADFDALLPMRYYDDLTEDDKKV